MPLDLVDFEELARRAVKEFWAGRRSAKRKQKKSGRTDQGGRSEVTAGKNMDGFLGLIKTLVKANGLVAATIHLERRMLTLPGFFRPSKSWDMLVMDRGVLVAALEFKSQVGPSFGNNFNNRAEESLGTAHDFWTAYREGALGDIPRPFLGWLMLVEDSEGSRRPVSDAEPHYPVFAEFRKASYVERYHVLCKKLMQEQLYTAATTLFSPSSAFGDGEFGGFDDLTSLKSFVASFAGHIASTAARNAGGGEVTPEFLGK